MANARYTKGRRLEYKARDRFCEIHETHGDVLVVRSAASRGPCDLVGICTGCRLIQLIQVKAETRRVRPKERRAWMRFVHTFTKKRYAVQCRMVLL